MTGSNDHDELYTTNCQAYFRETAGCIVQIFDHVVSCLSDFISPSFSSRKESLCTKETGRLVQSVVSAPSCREILGVPMHSYIECDSRTNERIAERTERGKARDGGCDALERREMFAFFLAT